MKKFLLLFVIIAAVSCNKKDNKRATTLSLTAAASDMGLLFEHKYAMVLYSGSGIMDADSITFHADSTITEKLYNDSSHTYVTTPTVDVHPSARNNTAIRISRPATSSGFGLLNNYTGDTVNFAYVGFYTSGPIFNIGNKATLGIMLSNNKYAILY